MANYNKHESCRSHSKWNGWLVTTSPMYRSLTGSHDLHRGHTKTSFWDCFKIRFSWQDRHQTWCQVWSNVWTLVKIWDILSLGDLLSSETCIEKDSHCHICVINNHIEFSFTHFFSKIWSKICNILTIYSEYYLNWVNVRYCIEGQLWWVTKYGITRTISNILNFWWFI